MSTRLEILKNLEQGKKATKLETEQYDYFNTAKDNYNKFNEQSWRKGMGYLLPSGHFPLFNEKMEGLESGLFLFAGESNCGKALALDTPILLANGQWTTIGAIQPGQQVWGDDGLPTTVLFKSEVFKNHKCYKITCDDGSTIIADADHRWKLYEYFMHKPHNRECVKTTTQMLKNYIHINPDGYPRYKYRIPMQAAIISYPEQLNLPIPPYALGIWLGNGNKDQNRITVHIQDYEEEKMHLEEVGIKVHGYKIKNGSLGVTYAVGKKNGKKNDFLEGLRKLNLLNNKHIPEQYLHSSIAQRWELLKGLMDSDGSVYNGHCEFCQKSTSRINDTFGELLSSLGIKWSSSEKNIILNGKNFYAKRYFFTVSQANTCFKRTRKTKLLRTRLSDRSFLYKTIIDITAVDTVPTQCIQVSNNSHCYLVGDHLTITHNTALLQELILQYASNPDNKLVGLYFSLDDTNDKIIPRILASHAQLLGSQEQGIPISVFSKPTRYLERLRQIDLDSNEAYILYSYFYDDISAGGTLIPENLNEDPDTFETSVRYRAYSWLKETSNYFHLVDGTTISNGEQLIEFCHNFKSYVQSINNNPDINLIVGIDSFSDIIWVEKHFNSDKELNDYTAQRMKALAVEELKCPIFGTIHLRKVDQKKRPNIADVKESGRWAYEASLVFLLHNDVSRNGEAATIFSTTDDSDFKLPIIEILWAKNKQSSFKGRTYCYFKTEFSRVWECSKEATERFNALLYSL